MKEMTSFERNILRWGLISLQSKKWSEAEREDRIIEYERNAKEFFKMLGFDEMKVYGDFIAKPLTDYHEVMHVLYDRRFFMWDPLAFESSDPWRFILMRYAPGLSETDNDFLVGLRFNNQTCIRTYNRIIWRDDLRYEASETILKELKDRIMEIGRHECFRVNVKPEHLLKYDD